ncbi:MAG: hypothetical protein RXN31_00505 [Candidatus Nanopusillus acidilobi]
MDSQQSYKSSEEISDLIQKEINKRVDYPIRELGDLLYKMAENAQKKANLSEIEELTAVIDLFCNKHDNNPMWCGHDIHVDVYSKDKGIRCLSNGPYLPDRVKCTDYSKIDFELYDPSQSAPFVQKIEDLILGTYNILSPRVLTDMGEQHIHIRLIYSINPNKPIKENPEISRGFYEFKYNNDRSNIKMEWDFYDPSELGYKNRRSNINRTWDFYDLFKL